MRAKVMRTTAVVLIFSLLLVYAISLLYPLLWTLLSTFKDEKQYILNPFGFPDFSVGFGNYIRTFELLIVKVIDGIDLVEYNIVSMFLNSFAYSAVIAFLSVLAPAITAYVITKYHFVGRNFLYSLAIVMMILPVVGSLPSSLRIMNTLGFQDNFVGVVIMMCGGFGFNFLLMCATFRSLSWGYAEAALIDGAGHFMVFFRIMLPLVKSTFFALFILSFINVWNDYMTPLVYLPSMPTISLGVFKFQFEAQSYGATMPQILSGFVLAMIPIIIIFICFQKIIMANMTAGGLKG